MSASLTPRRLLEALASLKLTIVAMSGLMVLVVFCTLAQRSLGTFGAVDVYMRSWLVWANLGGASVPVFPGGVICGGVLLVNLTAALVVRFKFSMARMGLWISHAGLVLLFAGEFVTGMAQKEMNLTFRQGETVNFLESHRAMELAVIDTTDPRTDVVHHLPTGLLKTGREVPVPGTPVSFLVKAFHPNAALANGANGGKGAATHGVGAMVQVEPLQPVSNDNQRNMPAAVVEARAGGQTYGTWLVHPDLGAPQSFTHEGRTYVMSMRPEREYLPFSLTLVKFSHDRYPGTDIPKNFSSQVILNAKDTRREVLISMNQPLRFGGRAFYQASYGEGDTVSILQVVRNPGWLLPYVSCSLVTLGLLLHFGVMLRRFIAGRPAAQEA